MCMANCGSDLGRKLGLARAVLNEDPAERCKRLLLALDEVDQAIALLALIGEWLDFADLRNALNSFSTEIGVSAEDVMVRLESICEACISERLWRPGA